ncbi:putative Protein tyrosine phosphatase [Taphrina deformans PYCC 5710]|uniref:Uncharacterized protein n=1 Tax=Taphrina deformans (strain PYCC 5710 / ATCC 11124 / CBS 356.35 / IMI 108563 / JCM 9778 / NBRC 8474) TaxID=1097556 RepID=R4X8M2_TAPDE|nr:putative Protein tyrosine phosphatase [Taphrina deformans PYCC 5710]|eukprot:CCG81979.1 putative Protein tyrosine phosphatase [Taphrina deformans PYCC 5710]
MAENLTTSDRIKLEAWSATSYVILYDADSFNIGQGTNLYQIASKFVTDNGLTKVMLVKGGFNAVLREAAHLVDAHEIEVARPHSSSDNGSSETPLRAFGGLARTDVAHSQPDLIGGVGEPIPLQIPLLFSKYRHRIPKWLRDLVEDPNGARYIADKFLKIEEEEQKRMQSVLDAGANEQEGTDQVRHSVAAGVERGDKNRYNNIWPFENARVRLKVDKHNQCDYINASHLHVPNSDKFYIATQGPLPGTTKDFWRMIWDNKIRTIVMLTRTVEGGQTKCHKYWDQAESIQPYDLRLLDENEVLGDDPAGTKMSFTTRKFLLRDMSENSNGSREVTQIQFADWPDFHIIQPEVILALIAEVQKAELPEDTPATKRYKSIGSHAISDITVPVLSHCSAGCGRTGVFCTVDTVINLLKKQLEPPIVNSDHTVDLVEATVRNFRDQRISMVQTYDPASSIRYTS